ncbi:MAG: helix-turn-helix domain-containing protein [Acutalibacter sp.]|nr:helix-turn-helix domain-containing protein [Acutalibacter sp.]
MLDYKDIGGRIRAVRMERKISQERLAEKVDVGTSHISHVETGKSFPSLQTFVDILNALDCSADELLCIEVEKARPIYDSWITEQLADCSQAEIKLVTELVLTTKAALRRLKTLDE